jgi:hypothetical protein
MTAKFRGNNIKQVLALACIINAGVSLHGMENTKEKASLSKPFANQTNDKVADRQTDVVKKQAGEVKKRFSDITFVFLNDIKNKKGTVMVTPGEQLTELMKQLYKVWWPKIAHELAYNPKMDVTDEQVIEYAKKNPYLQKISLSICGGLTDASIIKLAKSCKWLKEIYFSWEVCGCCHISDNVLKAIGENCKQLTSLNLSYCEKVTDKGLKAIGENCKQLRSLNLEMCRQVTDEWLNVIGENCKQLTHLDLGNCFLVTDVGIRVIGENCRQLTNLNLWTCRKVTDAGIKVIGENCKALIDFQLGRCQVTDEGIKVIGENCKKLQLIGLSHTSVTRAGRNKLKKIGIGIAIW